MLMIAAQLPPIDTSANKKEKRWGKILDKTFQKGATKKEDREKESQINFISFRKV